MPLMQWKLQQGAGPPVATHVQLSHPILTCQAPHEKVVGTIFKVFGKTWLGLESMTSQICSWCSNHYAITAVITSYTRWKCPKLSFTHEQINKTKEWWEASCFYIWYLFIKTAYNILPYTYTSSSGKILKISEQLACVL